MYGFFYNVDHKNKKRNPSSLYNKKTRDNRKLDLMRSILGSKKGTKSFLSPGNFDTLKANNKVINQAKMNSNMRSFIKQGDEFIENVNVMAPSTHAEIAERNLTGNALIGVSANANAAHAIFQLADNLSLRTSFRFNGVPFNELNNQYVRGTDKLITKVISETLAAFVDNGKEPQAKYSNINSYTVDVAMAMALAGLDLDTIQFFLSQPIIEEFVQSYFNNGGDAKAQSIVIKEFSEKYGIEESKFVVTHKRQIIPSKIINYNTEDLEASLGIMPASSQEIQNMLTTFLAYKKIARPVTNLINATKVGEKGLGPSDSDNLYRLDTLNEDNFEGIDGAMELLNRSDLFPYHLNKVIESGRKLILGDRDKGEFYLPDRNAGAFYLIREMFNNYKSGTNLTVNEIEFINKNFLDYLASSHEFFSFSKLLIATLPGRLATAKSLNSAYTDKYAPLLNRLDLDLDNTNKINYITYTGISGQDKTVINLIRDTWESMLYDNTEIEDGYTYADLANDLIKYSFMMSGFRISPQSFSHLQPVSFYSDFIPEFSSEMQKLIISAENLDYIVIVENDVEASQPFPLEIIDNFLKSKREPAGIQITTESAALYTRGKNKKHIHGYNMHSEGIHPIYHTMNETGKKYFIGATGYILNKQACIYLIKNCETYGWTQNDLLFSSDDDFDLFFIKPSIAKYVKAKENRTSSLVIGRPI